MRAEYRMMGEQFNGDGWENVEVDYFQGPLHEEHLESLRRTRDGMNELLTQPITDPRPGMLRRVWIERQVWEEVDYDPWAGPWGSDPDAIEDEPPAQEAAESEEDVAETEVITRAELDEALRKVPEQA